MSEQEETVKIPKPMADWIRNQDLFKLYSDLQEFVVDAVRRQMENWMRVEAR